jgi:hypothetical protein
VVVHWTDTLTWEGRFCFEFGQVVVDE